MVRVSGFEPLLRYSAWFWAVRATGSQADGPAIIPKPWEVQASTGTAESGSATASV
jgi:hypothetical protein